MKIIVPCILAVMVVTVLYWLYMVQFGQVVFRL